MSLNFSVNYKAQQGFLPGPERYPENVSTIVLF